MSEPRPCCKCGNSLPTQGPLGVCPACVLALGGTHDRGTRPAPFSVTEMASLFPGLEILEWLGEGGMGWVYLARQKNLNREVALKVMGPETWGDPHFVECFRREARVLAQLRHPNIIQVYEFGEVEGLCYLLMEYARGPRLDQRLPKGSDRVQWALRFFSQPGSGDEATTVSVQQLAAEDVLGDLKEVGEALAYAHDQGVLHRDVKPANILLCRDGDRWRLKLIDFGLSSPAGEGTAPTPLLAGTPGFAAPEQLARTPGVAVGPPADVYGFARTCCCVLLGTPQPAPRDWQKLPEALAELLSRCLSEAPGDRPPDMKAVLEDLDRLWKDHLANLDRYDRAASLYFALCGGTVAAAGAFLASGMLSVLLALPLEYLGLTGGSIALGVQIVGLLLGCSIGLAMSVLGLGDEIAGSAALLGTSRKPDERAVPMPFGERAVPMLLGLVAGAVSIGTCMHLLLSGERMAGVVGAALGAGLVLLPGLGAFLFPSSRIGILRLLDSLGNRPGERGTADEWKYGKRRVVLQGYVALGFLSTVFGWGMCGIWREELIKAGTPQEIYGVPLSIALGVVSFLLVCAFFLVDEVTLLLPRKKR